MSISKIFFIFSFLFSNAVYAQYKIQVLTTQTGVSIRSLSVPSDKVIWASGSKGMVAKSIDEGQSFDWRQIKGYEKRDFRAMHAWNEQEAIIVAIAAPAVILKTKDGGASWYSVYENQDTAMFLDAIHFQDEVKGTIVGDPIDGSIFMLTTIDKGESWNRVGASFFSTSLKNGEAFFASSNSNLIHVNNNTLMVTGGLTSRLWKNGEAMDLPLTQGLSSTGANSIAIAPNLKKIVIVGGDFSQDKVSKGNIVGYRLLLKPKTDQKNTTQNKLIFKPFHINTPNGYKSSVEFIDNHIIITCGTSGVAVSTNTGKNWKNFSTASFHVVKKHKNKMGAFVAGSGGRIGYIQLK